jgi:DNA-binding transcriptional ArsR family regulator
MSERELEKQLKALANRRRLAILRHLKIRREATVSEIADAIHLSLKATSKHLGMLSALDIVEREQRSLQVFYRLSISNSSTVKHVISLL